MRKMRKRATICLFLAAFLVIGLGFYVYQQFVDGGKWASYKANEDVYTNGYLATGSIYDRNGTLLLSNSPTGTATYNDDYDIRCATVHAVGDTVGNISTGAKEVFADKLVGYNFFFGTFSTNNKGRNLYLTLDADVCKTAYEALGDQNGCVGVYNYETGEIICMVSSPNYDPTDPPTVDSDDDSGIYVNKFLSATMTPGSTFKVITATAALENIDNIEDWTYTCPSVIQFDSSANDRVTCPYNHGTQDLEDALANSCNCAFAELSMEIGPDTLKEYTDKAGLTTSYSINGIDTTPGSFEFPSDDVTLSWSGIGQYNDLVNPCSMMIYMGAIANGGKTVTPTIVDSVKYQNGWNTGFSFKDTTAELVDPDTAATLDEYLHNDVVSNYGEYNFQGLDLCAKSGTAEVGDDENPHSWLVGYIRNDGYPYAFVVCVENGGTGIEVAGDVANDVMQDVIATPSLKSN